MTVKPTLPTVTLLAIDCTPKVHLAERAIEKSLEQCAFGAVKLLTDDRTRKWAVEIPKIESLQDYSRFCVQDLHKYVDTPHCLLVQSDGYVLNGAAWQDKFLRYDFIGAPWKHFKIGCNGGFSFRSKRLLQTLAKHPFGEPHPEDNYICVRHRKQLQSQFRINYPDFDTSSQFAYEGREWARGKDWVGSAEPWDGQFGFHSWLTPLPESVDRPTIFHHTGDYGDIIYSLPAIKAMGGGVLFMSPDNHYPYPRNTRLTPTPKWADNIIPLLEQQDYIWKAQFTYNLPKNLDLDFNSFREFYRTANPDNWTSLFRLHLKAAGTDYPENKAWLTVDYPVSISDRPIIVNRTSRYHNDAFPWQRLLRKYGDKMAFIGTIEEHAYFTQAFKVFIPHVQTPTFLDAARVIEGCKVFVGNQSAPMAIALGLNKPTVLEVWRANANCHFNRPNQIDVHSGLVDIPSSWL